MKFSPDFLRCGKSAGYEGYFCIIFPCNKTAVVHIHFGNQFLCCCNGFLIFRHLALRTASLFLEYGLFLFKLHNPVVELRLFQQVGVAGKDCHELGKVHAVFLVHAVLVDASHGNRAVVNLVYEHLLVLQQVKLIGIKSFLRPVNNDVNGVSTP